MGRTNFKLVLPVLVATTLLALSACAGGDPPPARASSSVDQSTSATASTPSPTPGPDEEAAPAPTPTPLPPLIERTEAESAVLEALAECTESVALSLAQTSPLLLFFDSRFSDVSRSWLSEVNTADFTVTFGTWRVSEGSRLEAVPDDRVSDRIATSGLECGYPSVLLEADPTPPRFGIPGAAFGDGVLIDSEELAAVQVWSRIYNCSQDFPDLSSFSATMDFEDKWLVEGRTDVTSYGLWVVDAMTGDVEPRDARAEQVHESCDAFLTTLTAEQAAIRVWVATYDCFRSPPPLSVFTAAQESPRRWVVEGRESVQVAGESVVTLYGLWQVRTDTGVIEGIDVTAQGIRAQIGCFKEFL